MTITRNESMRYRKSYSVSEDCEIISDHSLHYNTQDIAMIHHNTKLAVSLVTGLAHITSL